MSYNKPYFDPGENHVHSWFEVGRRKLSVGYEVRERCDFGASRTRYESES